MSAHSYIYVTIFYFLNYLFFKKKIFFFFLKMMLTYHISHEKIFSTALYVHGRSGVNPAGARIILNVMSQFGSKYKSSDLSHDRGIIRSTKIL